MLLILTQISDYPQKTHKRRESECTTGRTEAQLGIQCQTKNALSPHSAKISRIQDQSVHATIRRCFQSTSLAWPMQLVYVTLTAIEKILILAFQLTATPSQIVMPRYPDYRFAV
jgi:hypothetical protein